MHYEELSVRRLVIGGTDLSRPRAVIEVADDAVRLTLQGGRRQLPLVLEAKADGAARILIGDPEHGPSVEIEPQGMLLWLSGNVVAALQAREEGGALVLCDPDGRPVQSLPRHA